MFGNGSSAKVKDGRLVLSMPDAETPVVWVMDLNDATTSVLRLESDKQGLYVIKKHGGKMAETVAVYRNRRPAVKALTRATKALDRARTLRGQGSSRLTNILLIVLLVWFALSRFWSVDQDIMRAAIYPFIKDDLAALAQAQAQAQATAAQQQAAGMPAAQNTQPANPNAVGVPLSADDALQAEQDNAGRLIP